MSNLLSMLLLCSWAYAQDGDDVEPAAGTMVVQGQATQGPDPQSSSASVSVIQVDERIPASWDVARAVDSVSGTTVLRLGGLGDYSSLSIRGSSTRQVQVHLDGIPLNPDGSGAVNLSELPLQSFERVEVYRGNAPPQFGAAPMGGVVNLVTGERSGQSLYASLGSYGTQRLGGSWSGSHRQGQVRTLVLAEALRTQGDFDYFSDSGTRYTLIDDSVRPRVNNDAQQLSTLTRVQLDLGRWQLTALDSLVLREGGLAGHSGARSFQARLLSQRNLAALEAKGSLSSVALSGRLWTLSRGDTLDDRAGEVGAGTQWQRTQSQQLGALADATWSATPWLLGSATAWARWERGSSVDLLALKSGPAHQRGSYGGALSADIWLWQERLRISPVLQGGLIDNRELGVEQVDTALHPPLLLSFTPRVGALLRPVPALALKANIGRYYRPPDFSELYGDRGALLGNDALRPEQGWQADLGVRLVAPAAWQVSGTLELGHFWQSSTDLITWTQNSQRTLVAQNIGKAWVQGLEASLQLDALGWVDSQSNLTRMVSVNLVDEPSVANNQLPRLPLWELSQQSSVHWQERVRLGHQWTYVAQSYWDQTNWYLAPPRSLHNVFVRVKPLEHPAVPSLELSLLNVQDRIVEPVPRNVLDPSDDSLILQPLTDFVGYPLPGRSVLLTLRWAP